ncbi:Elongation of fatty acids protein 3 [Neolecta irregularis DAH-3]|uniref:Elongation of fatty acids protein n=1 Tax=Neolecta irregularis (strain DAH-3) TaxID=1198029 RepID=A0A1U7LPQ3_NEOID|nr:Elongation of fatty acids protein 3 [Neolecta irregularis DAH-3]|eukprot:OLL24635.1 Elongation of fatty acids protein 3 [Neolecta irregularis DAH-3]
MLPSSSADSFLWPIFDSLYSRISSHNTASFAFIPGKTFLATNSEVAVAIVSYYALIFGGQALMRNLIPMPLNRLFQLTNLFLTVISALLLLLFLEQLIPIFYSHGLLYAICSDEAWTQELLVLYYMNYLIKYVELLDTVFLVLKKKKLTFLHPYHHGTVIFLCYNQLRGRTSAVRLPTNTSDPKSWVVIVLNLAVHVLMYWYYFLSSRGISVWWKKWVTRAQIIQFVIGAGTRPLAFISYLSCRLLCDLYTLCLHQMALAPTRRNLRNK